MDVSSLPFNKTLGLTSEGGRVVLVPQPQHLNHLDTVHAAAVYSVAEAASGHFLLQRFSEVAESYVAVVRGSTAKYRRPANLGSPLFGLGTLPQSDAEEFLTSLNSRGKASVTVEVSVTQNEVEIFTGKFNWLAGRK